MSRPVHPDDLKTITDDFCEFLKIPCAMGNCVQADNRLTVPAALKRDGDTVDG